MRRLWLPRDGLLQKHELVGIQEHPADLFDPELVGKFIHIVSEMRQTDEPSVNGVSKQAALQIGLQIEKLACALDAEDVESLAAMAGRLKSTASQYGIAEIVELTTLLEQTTQEDPDWMDILRITTDLLELCRMTQRALTGGAESDRDRELTQRFRQNATTERDTSNSG